MKPAVSRLVRNTAWNSAGRVIAISTSIVLTPYLLAKLGQEAFGLWAFSWLLLGYLSLLDLGIQGSLVRQIAHSLPDQHPERFSRILSSSFYTFLGMGAALLPLMLWLAPIATRAAVEWRPSLLSAGMLDEGVFVVTLTASTIFFWIAATSVGATLPGVQRMDLSNKLGMLAAVLMLIGSVGLVESGFGVGSLIILSLALRACDALICFILIHKLYPQLRLTPANFDVETLKELYAFAWRTQVSRLSELFSTTVDRLFVGAFGGALALGRYHPALQIVNQARLLPPVIISAMLPYASELSAQKDHPALLKLYFEGSRYLAFATFSLLGFLIATAPLLVEAWLGPGYDEIAVWVRIFCAGYLVSGPIALGGLLSQAMGYPGLQARSSILMAALNLVFAPSGYFLGGITGLTIGGSMAIVIANARFFITLHRTIHVSAIKVIRECFAGPAAWLGIAAAAVWYAGGFWTEPPEGRLEACLRLGMLGAVFAPLALVSAKQLDLLERPVGIVSKFFSRS